MSTDKEVLVTELDRLRLQLQTLQAKTGTEDITIGSYLLSRLAQLGVTVSLLRCIFWTMSNSKHLSQSMFGLPGDFNLGFLVRLVSLALNMSSLSNPFDYRTWSRTIPKLTGLATGMMFSMFTSFVYLHSFK